MLSLPTISEPDQRILVEQVRILYRTLLPILAITLIVGSGTVYALWGVVSPVFLSVWLGMLLLMVLVRVIIYISYRRSFKPEHAARHGLYFILGSAAAGLLWGIGGVLLYPAQGLEYQLFILVVLVGMGAGSLSSLTTYLPAFFAYFPTSMLPISIRFMLTGEPLLLSLGIMTLAYVAALCYFGLNINRSLIQSLKLRFENIELVEQLRQQKDEAEQANIAKTKFLAAASHDLRQPLHALSLFTSVLDESIQYPKVRRVVDQIKASVQALQNLFNALLDISRLEAGVMKVEKIDFPLQPILDKLNNDYTPQAREKALQISWPVCNAYVHSDPSLLEQILRNYVSNAIRYTEHGEVKVLCNIEDGHVCIQVHDTGIGIPASEKEAIFKEFHQLGNPERDRSKGLGLGLAIVQRTANLLGHTIAVKSVPGHGSTFSINVQHACLDAKIPDNTPVDMTSSHATSTAAMVVVIDDETSVLEATRSLLELWGCEVITATDTAKAIELLNQQSQRPDGIIADYRLRGNQTGIDAIKQVQGHYAAAIPAVIVTGDIATERLREVNDSGFPVLHKPVAPARLRAFVRNIESHRGHA